VVGFCCPVYRFCRVLFLSISLNKNFLAYCQPRICEGHGGGGHYELRMVCLHLGFLAVLQSPHRYSELLVSLGIFGVYRYYGLGFQLVYYLL